MIKEKILKQGLIYFFIFLPLLYYPFSYSILAPKEILFTLFAFFLVFLLFNKNEIKLKKITLIPLFFILWCFLAILFSKYKFAGFVKINIVILSFFYFLFFSNFIFLNKNFIRDLILFTSLPFLSIGILQLLGIDFPKGLMVFGSDVPSTFGNPNFFAAYLTGIMPFFLDGIIKEKQGKKFLSIFIFLVSLFLLFRTGSKAAILVFLLLILAYFFIYIKVQIKVKIILTTILILFSSLIFYFNFNKIKNNESVFFRINVWKGTINLIADNFISGVGPGAFSFSFPKYRPAEIMKWAKEHSYEITQPENIFLQILAETGIIGLLFFLFFLYLLFKNFNNDLLPFYAGVFGILGVNFFGVDLNYITSIFLFTFLSTIVFYNKSSKEFLIKGKIKNIFLFLIIIYFSVIFIFQITDFASDIYLKKAIDFSKEKNWDNAIKNYNESLKLNNYKIDALYFLANAYYDSGNLQEALKTFEKLEKLVPNYILTNYKKANIYMNLNDIQKAKEEYGIALKFDPYLKQANEELAFIYYREQKFNEAEKLLKKILEKYSDDASVYNNLGNIYFASKRIDEAIEAYKKAIELKKDKDYYYNLGCVYFTLNDFYKAKENLLAANELNKDKDEKITKMLNMVENYVKIKNIQK
jgi:tetratricopeptide (TPR) repeat protein